MNLFSLHVRSALGIALFALAAPSLALAQNPVADPTLIKGSNDYDEYPWHVPHDDRRPRRLVSSIVLLGGAGDYTAGIGRYTIIGPNYGVVIAMQPLRFLGIEVGYSGSRNELDLLRFPELERASIWRNGATAMVKLGIPYDAIRPFIGAGFGLGYVSVSGSNNGGLLHNDFVGELPLSIGVEVNGRRFNAGVRATYHLLVDASFIPSASNGVWGGPLEVQATLGARF